MWIIHVNYFCGYSFFIYVCYNSPCYSPYIVKIKGSYINSMVSCFLVLNHILLYVFVFMYNTYPVCIHVLISVFFCFFMDGIFGMEFFFYFFFISFVHFCIITFVCLVCICIILMYYMWAPNHKLWLLQGPNMKLSGSCSGDWILWCIFDEDLQIV